MKKIVLIALLWLVPSSAEAVTYSCTNGIYDASADVTLGAADNIDLSGTATARCLVKMDGFRWILPASYTGSITLNYADIYDCGTATTQCIGGSTGAVKGILTSSNVVTITNTNWHRSGAMAHLTFNGTSDAVIAYNKYWADNIVATSNSDPGDNSNTMSVFAENGSSTTAKEFKGNILERGYVILASANWTVGVANGTTCASGFVDSNFFTGRRTGVTLAATTGGFIRCNYLRGNQDVAPNLASTGYDEETWSQVSGIGVGSGGTGIGSSVILEHNVIRQFHWPVQGINGEVRFNVVTELNPHQYIRSIGGGSVHHNILATLYPGLDRYDSSSRLSQGDEAMALTGSGNTGSFYNNTMDGRGKGLRAAMHVVSGATLTSYRSNVIAYLTLVETNCTVGVATSACTSALMMHQDELQVASPPERATYIDYNDFYFVSTRKVVYGIKVTGIAVCADNAGLHDLGTCNGQGVDPQFRGNLPIGTGETGQNHSSVTAANVDSGFPFNDADILPVTPGTAGRYKVSDLLAYYRWVYAPTATTSPLLNAQDPADGTDHMGAVRATDIGAEPSIHSGNTPPMVWPGARTLLCDLSDNNCDGTLISTIFARLGGYGSDDGTTITLTWSKVNGPGTVTFAHSSDGGITGNRPNTTCTFSATGVYTLRLTATDGTLTTFKDIVITVQA